MCIDPHIYAPCTHSFKHSLPHVLLSPSPTQIFHRQHGGVAYFDRLTTKRSLWRLSVHKETQQFFVPTGIHHWPLPYNSIPIHDWSWILHLYLRTHENIISFSLYIALVFPYKFQKFSCFLHVHGSLDIFNTYFLIDIIKDLTRRL